MAKVQLHPAIVTLMNRYSANKPQLQRGFLGLVLGLVAWKIRSGFSKSPAKKQAETTVTDMPSKKGRKGKTRVVGAVDSLFFARFKRIFKIIVPGAASKEFFLLTLFSGFLVRIVNEVG
jgi:hypothetical protein